MKNQIQILLILGFFATTPSHSYALDHDCIYGQYPTMQNTWGTWTEWTDAEEAYYDYLDESVTYMRWSPFPIVTKGDNDTFYNYESFSEPLKGWFTAPNGRGEYWAINPISIAILDGEVETPVWNTCGATSEELIVE